MSDDGVRTRPIDPAPPLTGDWPSQAADAVVDLVDAVRDKTVGPLQMIARVLVYGLVVVPVAIMAVVLLLIGLVRMADNFAPGDVYWVYLVLGVIFTAIGLASWTTRRPKGS